MNNNKSLTPTAIILLLISVLLWALAFPLLKITLDYIPPLAIGYFRYFFASLPFLVYIFIKYDIKDILKELHSNGSTLIALGITMVTIPNIAQNIGLQYTTSSIAALISTVAPVFTVILAILILHELASWQKVFGMTIAITASIIMVVYTDLEVSEATFYGNVLIFITAVSYGISAIFSKIALNNSKPVYLAGFGMLFGSIILFPLSIMFNEPLDWPINVATEGWIYLIILTLFPCMLATFLWYVVLQGHEVSKQVLFTYLIPLFAAIFAYLMLGEILHPVTILLGILIILGISLAEGVFKKNKNKKKN